MCLRPPAVVIASWSAAWGTVPDKTNGCPEPPCIWRSMAGGEHIGRGGGDRGSRINARPGGDRRPGFGARPERRGAYDPRQDSIRPGHWDGRVRGGGSAQRHNPGGDHQRGCNPRSLPLGRGALRRSAGEEPRRSEPLRRLAGGLVRWDACLLNPCRSLAEVIFDLGKRPTTLSSEEAELLAKLCQVLADRIVVHPAACSVRAIPAANRSHSARLPTSARSPACVSE